jgi:exopolyphosphatase/guanosine-5'-triphosphate,3'-diphosphate pyrophosphatase
LKLGAIDVGSNAVRLLLMNVYESESGPVFIKDSMYRIPLRLGEEAFLNGKLSKEKVKMMVKTFKAFKNILEVHQAYDFMACATSAMRSASNQEEIVEKIKSKTGIELNVISGKEEADVIFSNQIEQITVDGASNYLYIDVGGGSTELVLLSEGKLVAKESFDIGTLRIKNNMVDANTWLGMKNWILSYRDKYDGVKGIGSGGNINYVFKNYTKNKNNTLSLDVIEVCHSMLKVIPDLDKQITFGMRPDRADVIVPALEIFRKVMDWMNMDEILVPKLGLPDGIIKRLYYAQIQGKQ